MSNNTIVSVMLNGGNKEVPMPISQVYLPNIWPIIKKLKDSRRISNKDAEAIYLLWDICNGLKQHIVDGE